MDKRLELFAATPPLEALRVLCSVCASKQDGPKPCRMMSVDIKRAYFYAPALRPVYIETLIEDWRPGDEGNVARINLSLYGTRDAAQNWAAEYTRFLVGLVFQVGKGSPCNFRHEKRDIQLSVHRDDFTVVGPMGSLRWLKHTTPSRYEITADFLGPEEDPGVEPYYPLAAARNSARTGSEAF